MKKSLGFKALLLMFFAVSSVMLAGENEENQKRYCKGKNYTALFTEGDESVAVWKKNSGSHIAPLYDCEDISDVEVECDGDNYLVKLNRADNHVDIYRDDKLVAGIQCAF